MALKELIATPGEAAAGKIMSLFRYSGEARRQLYEAIRAEVDQAVSKERYECAMVADLHDGSHAEMETGAAIAEKIRTRHNSKE